MATLAGDQSGFQVLVDRYKEKIYRLAFRYLGDHSAAEGASMEAFLNAYKGLPRFNGKARFETWLYRIALNVCKTHIRRINRERARFVPLESDDYSDQTQKSPRGNLLEKELEMKVKNAIDDLPAKLKSVWVLFAAEGMKIAEIAEIEECSVGAVKNRLFHARKKLQKTLSRYMEV